MLRKLSFILILAMLLSACGASAPMDDAMESPNGAAVTEAAAEAAPVDSEPSQTASAGEGTNAEYFRITKHSTTVSDEDGNALLYENYALAEFSSVDPERSEWVGDVLGGLQRDFQSDSANLQEYAREFVQEYGTDQFYSYSNYQQLDRKSVV